MYTCFNSRHDLKDFAFTFLLSQLLMLILLFPFFGKKLFEYFTPEVRQVR